MGKSAKAKNEKKKDFQKAKLKVGKTKPKAANFTDTSFKARSISVLQQNLTTNAPSVALQFSHHLALLSHKSDSQRRDSLSYLTTALLAVPASTPLPQPVSLILPKVQPLIRDTSSEVRAQLLKLLSALPPDEVHPHTEGLLLWIRLGMTHLSTPIRLSSLDVLEWLLNTAGAETVSCAGGWSKTLKCFAGLLGWDTATGPETNNGSSGDGHKNPITAWTSTPSTAGKSLTDVKLITKTLNTLMLFLETGLRAPRTSNPISPASACRTFPICDLNAHMLPGTSDPYAYLNLFGPPLDEEGMAYEDLESRGRYFSERWRRSFEKGVERVKREGGGVGRAGVGVERVMVVV